MPTSQRIPSLDGVRAISIALVIAGHWSESHLSGAARDIAGAFANVGVRIFFVLSGYLITRLLLAEHATSSTLHLRQFYRRRAFRILPASACFMVIAFVVFRHQLSWGHAIAAVLYLTNFDPHHPWFLGHLWSLSVEEQFYALWPAALKKWYPHRTGILLAVIAFAPLYRVLYHIAGQHGRWDETFPAVADILGVGCLLAVIEPRLPRIPGRAALICVLPLVVVPTYSGLLHFHVTAVLLLGGWPLLHLSIAALLLHVTRCPYWLLNVGPVMWIGKISYSLYLWQQLFVFGPSPRPALLLPFAAAAACASYYLIELPMLKLGRSTAQAASCRAESVDSVDCQAA